MSRAESPPMLASAPAAVASGLLLTLAFPLQFWSFAVPASWQGYSAWIAWTPVLLAVYGLPPRQVALWMGLSGLLMFAGTTFWIVVAMVEYGGVPWILALLALGLLSALLATFHALAGGLAAWARDRSGLPLTLTFPLALVGLELARNSVLTGFPWSNLAYSQARFLSIAQIAEWTGIYGLTFLLALSSGALVELLRLPEAVLGRWKGLLLGVGGGVLLLVTDLIPVLLRIPRETNALFLIGWMFSALLLVATLGLGIRPSTRPAALFCGQLACVLLCSTVGRRAAFLESDAPIGLVNVALLQGNISQDQKWLETASERIKQTYRAQTEEALVKNADLVVWPEASVPDVLPANLEYLPAELFPAGGPGAVHVVGAPVYIPGLPGELTLHNSAFLVGPDLKVLGRYDKSHLVPFGEYVPLRELLDFLGPMVEAVGTFAPGIRLEPLSDGQHPYGVVICYEDIFPEIGREQVRNGAQLLLNITNDAWYGPTSALQQHLDMAVFRAIETRRAVARAANTGISAFIAPTGQIVGRSIPWEPAVMVAPMPLLTRQTFYVRHGDVFALGCVGLWITVCMLPTLRRRGAARPII